MSSRKGTKRSNENNPRNDGKSMNKASNKKRQREERLQQFGVDLPDIAGLPAEVIPLQVHAIKATTKWIQQDSSDALVRDLLVPTRDNYDNNSAESNNTRIPGESSESKQDVSILDTVLGRLDATAMQSGKTSHSTAQHRDSQQRQARSRDAIQAWLQCLARHVRDRRSHHHQAKLVRFSAVVIASWQHLWDLASTHSRWAVRRAATHLMRHLLHRSTECRQWLLAWDVPVATNNDSAATHEVESTSYSTTASSLPLLSANTKNDGEDETQLLNWLNLVAAASALTVNDDESNMDALQRSMWQAESYLVLHDLIQQPQGKSYTSDYATMYPALMVAMRRFTELLGPRVLRIIFDSSSSSSSTADRAVATTTSSNNMVEWRHTRDVALVNCDKESERVHKLIMRAQAFMDILVPRFGQERDDHVQQAATVPYYKDQAQLLFEDGLTATNQTNSEGCPVEEDIEHELDDVEWEDGWDPDDSKADAQEGTIQQQRLQGVGTIRTSEATRMENPTFESHQEAVERTIIAIQATGGVMLQDGELAINWVGPQTNWTGNSNRQDAMINHPMSMARLRLARVVQLLSDRHLPRLSEWVEALDRADQLTPGIPDEGIGLLDAQQRIAAVSLVSVPAPMRERRAKAHEALSQLKRDVASILALAQRLGVHATINTTAANDGGLHRQPQDNSSMRRLERKNMASVSTQANHRHLVERMVQQQQQQHQRLNIGRSQHGGVTRRSNRIQIKYRKF